MALYEDARPIDDTVLVNAESSRQVKTLSHDARQHVRPAVTNFVPGPGRDRLVHATSIWS